MGQLIDYLKEKTSGDNTVELWSIWFGEIFQKALIKDMISIKSCTEREV